MSKEIYISSTPHETRLAIVENDALTEIYYERVFGKVETWSVPTLGGNPKRVLAGFIVTPTPDGNSLYFIKEGTRAIYRADRTGMGEEQVAVFDPNTPRAVRILPYPDGKRLLLVTENGISTRENFHPYVVELGKPGGADLGELSGEATDVVWSEAGKSVLFGRTVNGLTNIWKLDLGNEEMTQVTFGPGPDRSPMPCCGSRRCPWKPVRGGWSARRAKSPPCARR